MNLFFILDDTIFIISKSLGRAVYFRAYIFPLTTLKKKTHYILRRERFKGPADLFFNIKNLLELFSDMFCPCSFFFKVFSLLYASIAPNRSLLLLAINCGCCICHMCKPNDACRNWTVYFKR